MNTNNNSTFKLIGIIILFIILNFAALAIGNVFTSVGVKSQWYHLLNKAPWTPAGWVFGFAWTTIMLCFAFYMAFLWNRADRKIVLALYSLQWILNVSWNPIFFKLHQTVAGLIVISLLLILITFMLFRFLKILGRRTLFIIPYWLWLMVAISLNAYICFNN